MKEKKLEKCTLLQDILYFKLIFKHTSLLNMYI
jgi:hypothetical protein